MPTQNIPHIAARPPNEPADSCPARCKDEVSILIDHSTWLGKYVPQVDRLDDELLGEQEKFKAITEELDQTFAEMSGY